MPQGPENATQLRISNLLTARNMSMRELSIAAGMNPDTLGKFMTGKTQSLKANNLSAVAAALGVSESWLFGTSEDPNPPSAGPEFGVRFGGVVEAGNFRPDDGLNQDNEWRFIPVQPDPRYPSASQYAFEVRGDSMDRAHVVEGMWALAVDVETWERLHGQVPSGKLVVVAKTRNGDPERELTVKRLQYFRDRMELQPESSNATHEPLVFPLPLAEDALQHIHIIAVVLQSTWIYG